MEIRGKVNWKLNEEILVKFDRIIVFFLCGLIFVLPFSKSLVEIFFVCGLIIWTAPKIADSILRHTPLVKSFKLRSTGLNLPIIIFVFFGLLSTLASVSFSLSLEGFFLKLLEGVLLYYIVSETVCDKGSLNWILVTMFFSILLISTDAIFQLIKGVDFLRNHNPGGVYMLQASFGTANSFGTWLVVMSTLVLSIACFGKEEWFGLMTRHNYLKQFLKPFSWCILILLFIFLFLTLSAGAWAAMLLALVFIGILRGRKLLIGLIMVLLILSSIIVTPVRNIILPSVITIMRNITPASVKSAIPVSIKRDLIPVAYTGIDSGSFRIESWKEAINIIKDFPAFGCGLNTYTIAAPYYKISEGGGIYPHNSYLHMAAESGLLGLGAFISIIVTLLWASLANLRKIKDEYYKTLLVAFLAALFGFLAHSFVDVNIYSLQLNILMWFMMGLIVAIQRIALREVESKI